MDERRVGWGVSVDRLWEGSWSFGICLSHNFDETYVFINFFKWSISIGRILKPVKDEYYERG